MIRIKMNKVHECKWLKINGWNKKKSQESKWNRKKQNDRRMKCMFMIRYTGCTWSVCSLMDDKKWNIEINEENVWMKEKKKND